MAESRRAGLCYPAPIPEMSRPHRHIANHPQFLAMSRPAASASRAGVGLLLLFTLRFGEDDITIKLHTPSGGAAPSRALIDGSLAAIGVL